MKDIKSQKILIWDLPTRVFHWSLAICFIGAVLTQESEKYRLFHVSFGYTMLGLIIFRLLWGVIGTRYSRFSSFLFGFKEIKGYILGLVRNRPVHYLGHNPIGSIAIYLILTIVLGISITGYCIFNDVGANWYSEAHELMANFLIGIVVIHILGVIASSLLHKENLVRSMLSGLKEGSAQDGIQRRSVYLVIALAMIAGIVYFWILQFGVV